MEIWKPIPNFENLYEVSNAGRLRRKWKNGYKLLGVTKNTSGHLSVCLCKENKKHYYRVHRLVAEVFIPNPQNLTLVEHLNDIKTDNRVENLKWSTNKENNIRAYTLGAHEGAYRKPLRQKATGYEFESSYRAAEYIREQQHFKGKIETIAQQIRNCANGHTLTAYGSPWEFI